MTEKDIKLTTLGLAARAGKTVAGTQMVCEALKDGKAFLVIEAAGNSDNTKKRIQDRCNYYHIPLILCTACSADLGAAVGHGPSACVAITDRNLACAVAGTKDLKTIL